MPVYTLSESGVDFTDRRDFPLDENEVNDLWPNVAPFLAYLNMLETRELTKDRKFKMFEDRSGFVAQYVQINDAAPPAWPTTGAPGEEITVKIDGLTGISSSVAAHMIGLHGEINTAINGTGTFKGTFIIKAVNTTDSKVTLVATGNPDSATGVNSSLADDDYLWIYGPQLGLGKTAVEAWHEKPGVVYNECGLVEVALELDEDTVKMYLRGTGDSRGREIIRQRSKKQREFLMQRNRLLLFGSRWGGTGMGVAAVDNFASQLYDADGKLVPQSMGGISIVRQYGSTTGDNQNLWSFDLATIGTSVTWAEIIGFSEKLSQYVPDSYPILQMFCGRGAVSAWNILTSDNSFIGNSQGTFRLDEAGSNVFGYNVRRLKLPHCELEIVTDPALRGPYHNSFYIPNSDNVFRAEWNPPMFHQNVKTDDLYHGQKDVYNVDEGIGKTLVETHHFGSFANVPS